MKRLVMAAVVIAFIVGLATPANADLTFWLGRITSDDLYIDGTTAWGGAIGFNFLEYLGIELVADYMPNSELPFDLEEVEDLLKIDLSVDMLFVSGNVVVQYPLMYVTPYFSVGYGGFGTRLSTKTFGLELLQGTTARNFAFGVKVDVSPGFAVRGDYRIYTINLVDADVEDYLGFAVDPTFRRLAVGVALTF